VKYLNILRF